MKITLQHVLAFLVLTSCSAPKYTYNFDYHDYNAGRKDKRAMKEVASDPGPVAVVPESLVANAPESVSKVEIARDETSSPAATTRLTTTKKETKQLKRELKEVLRKARIGSNSPETTQATAAIDRDLQLAAIFGAVGIVAYIIGGSAFWIIGSVAMIIGVIFFVRWLLRQ